MFIGAEGGSGSGPAAVQSRARGRKPQLWRRPCCATRHVCQLGAHVVSLSLRSGPARACAEPAPLVPSFYITQRRSPTSLPVGLFFFIPRLFLASLLLQLLDDVIPLPRRSTTLLSASLPTFLYSDTPSQTHLARNYLYVP